MICHRCRSSILTRLQHQTVAWSVPSGARTLSFQPNQFRNYSEVAASTPPQPRQPVAAGIVIPSAPAASVSPASGVSEGTASDVKAQQPEKSAKPAVEHPPSSCPPGTKLQGLNYFKNKPDLVALEDSEYPDWLWTLLDDPKKDAKKGGVDPSTLNKKQRKRYEKKMAARAATLPPKIPVHHHATDITPAPYNLGEQGPRDTLVDATESIEKRSEITKSAREARRKAIREANFLRGL